MQCWVIRPYWNRVHSIFHSLQVFCHHFAFCVCSFRRGLFFPCQHRMHLILCEILWDTDNERDNGVFWINEGNRDISHCNSNIDSNRHYSHQALHWLWRYTRWKESSVSFAVYNHDSEHAYEKTGFKRF